MPVCHWSSLSFLSVGLFSKKVETRKKCSMCAKSNRARSFDKQRGKCQRYVSDRRYQNRPNRIQAGRIRRSLITRKSVIQCFVGSIENLVQPPKSSNTSDQGITTTFDWVTEKLQVKLRWFVFVLELVWKFRWSLVKTRWDSIFDFSLWSRG